MSMTKPWTDREEKAVAKAVAKAKTIDEAVALAKKAAPDRAPFLSRSSIDQRLSRSNLPTIAQIIAKAQAEAYAKNPPKDVAKPEKDDLAEHRLRVQMKEVEATNARLVEQLNVAKKQNATLLDMQQIRPLKPVVARKGRGEHKQRQGCPVMLCSDWHVEEPVESEKVNGLNSYDLDIADKCIDQMAEAWEWMLTDQRYDCRQGVLWLGGDLFSGFIHEELMEKNFLSPTRACAWLLPRLEKMIRKILANSPRLERLMIPCNDGNHGRTTHKIRVSSRTENSLEWFMYFNLAERLKDEPRAQFQIAEGEYNFMDVFGQTLCFFHGDSVRYQGGVGGILVPLKRGLNELRKYQPEGKKIDVFNLGHFHQLTNDPGVTINGSMIGINPYAMRNKFAPERRQQAWYMIDATRGKCLTAPIWLPKTGLL